MGYIRFNVTRITDASGRTITASVKRMESDMDRLSTLQPNMVYNALSFRGKVDMLMKLDEGVLDRDKLGDSEYLVIGEGLLGIDKLV